MSGKDTKEAPAASTSANDASGSSGGPSAELMAAVQARLAALSAGGGAAQAGQPQRATKTQRKQRYAFWETQPVVQFDAEEEEVGPWPSVGGWQHHQQHSAGTYHACCLRVVPHAWPRVAWSTAYTCPTERSVSPSPCPPPCMPAMQQEDGPIDKPKTVADVKKEPYALPDR
jgi:hypothetical protein